MVDPENPGSFRNKCNCVNSKTNLLGSKNWPFISAIKNNPGSSLSMVSRCSVKLKKNKIYKFNKISQSVNVFGRKSGGPSGFGSPPNNFK